MRNLLFGACLAAGVLAPIGSAYAITATVAGKPPVSVSVPSGFAASDSNHGVEIKTPDEEVMVWCETYTPGNEKAMQAEYKAYWKDQKVVLGEPEMNSSDDGVKVDALTFTKATYKGDPTIVQYLFVDANLPSKEMILMTVWASPEGYLQHKDAIKAMMGSITIK